MNFFALFYLRKSQWSIKEAVCCKAQTAGYSWKMHRLCWLWDPCLLSPQRDPAAPMDSSEALKGSFSTDSLKLGCSPRATEQSESGHPKVASHEYCLCHQGSDTSCLWSPFPSISVFLSIFAVSCTTKAASEIISLILSERWPLVWWDEVLKLISTVELIRWIIQMMGCTMNANMHNFNILPG